MMWHEYFEGEEKKVVIGHSLSCGPFWCISLFKKDETVQLYMNGYPLEHFKNKDECEQYLLKMNQKFSNDIRELS